MRPLTDVALVGAGPVGATLALALARAEVGCVAFDARAPGASLRGDRTLALSRGSRLILERLGLWRALDARPGAVTPILRVDVSQSGTAGSATLDAAEAGLPALGYVVSYLALQAELDAALARAGVDVRYGATVERVDVTPAHARVDVAGDAIDARLAVVADGAGTTLPGIARERRDYGQVAVVGKVATAAPHDGLAYERFTPDGPIALLPEQDHYGFVWTLAPPKAQAMLALDDDAFAAAFADAFGRRRSGLGRVWQRRSYPLALEVARPAVAARVAAIGNAAQTLHPVAGQGLNLGLRDAWGLAREIVASPRESLGTAAMLARYAASRRVDRWGGIAFTHGLVQLFRGGAGWLAWPRGAGLAALDLVAPLKRSFTRAMLYGA